MFTNLLQWAPYIDSPINPVNHSKRQVILLFMFYRQCNWDRRGQVLTQGHTYLESHTKELRARLKLNSPSPPDNEFRKEQVDFVRRERQKPRFGVWKEYKNIFFWASWRMQFHPKSNWSKSGRRAEQWTNPWALKLFSYLFPPCLIPPGHHLLFSSKRTLMDPGNN